MAASTWWHRELWADWAGVAFVAVLLVVVQLSQGTTQRYDLCSANGNKAPCNSTDPAFDAALGYPSPPETVTTVELGLLCVLLPLAVIALVQTYYARQVSRWPAKHDVHNALLTLLQSALTVILVTEVTKRYVGRYRPSYYAIAAADKSDHALKDAHWSYPSGHASVSFCCMTFVTLYLLGKTKAFVKGPGQFPTVLGCLSFMFLAGYVSATRLVDYKHNPSDVNAGAFIGLSIGAIIYHLHFFPVVHPNCYLPRFHPKANGAIHGQGGRLSSPYLSELEDA